MEDVLAHHKGNHSSGLHTVPHIDHAGLCSATRQVLEPGVVFPVFPRGYAKIAVGFYTQHRSHHLACFSTFGRRDRLQPLVV